MVDRRRGQRIPYRMEKVERRVDGAGGGGGVTDHGALTGLGNDDHTQYHNNARGDARYTAIAHASDTGNPHAVTKAQVGLGSVDNVSAASLRDRSTHTGTQLASTISDFSEALDDRVATLIVAGALTTTSYNDGANTLTVGLSDVATATVFYRKTAGTGAPEVQTLATLKTDLGLTGTNSGDQTITLTGDVTGSGTGSFAATLANSGVSAGTYTGATVTFDAKGRATSASSGPMSYKAISSNVVNGTTTGVKVTQLDATLATGSYLFEYFLPFQCASVSNSLKLGINFTGTKTFFSALLRLPTDGTTGISIIQDGETTAAPTIMGCNATRTLTTTAPNMGPIGNMDTANADQLIVVEGIMVVSVSGNIELWHASEIASNSTLFAGGLLRLTKVT